MSITKLAYALLVIAGIAVSAPSHSAVLFSDNFDADSAVSVLNYNSLINWTVSDGTIDYIRSGGFGISCVGGIGGCLDMDGSTGNSGRITSKATFTLLPGITYFLDAEVSGNQRVPTAADSIIWGFADPITGTPLVQSNASRAGNAPFSPIGVAASYGSPQSVRLFFEGIGGDNIGVILDNVVLRDDTPDNLPEPGALALLGLGLTGLAVSRRRQQ